MPPEDQQEEPKFRKSTRAPLVAATEIQYAGFKEKETLYTANISVDGMFVQTETPKPVGVSLRFELYIHKNADPIRGFGEVAWLRVRNEGPGNPAGMGIQFRYVEENSQQPLRQAVANTIRASSTSGGVVSAPALSASSEAAKEALNRVRKKGGESKPAEESPVAGGRSRISETDPMAERRKEFKFGTHAEKAAELRLKRMTEEAIKAGQRPKKLKRTKDGALVEVEDEGKFGLSGKGTRIILPLFISALVLFLIDLIFF
jgi:uncharacterized protein (TIGR02266 family)